MATGTNETNGKTANLQNLMDPLPVCGRVIAGGCSGSGAFFSNQPFTTLNHDSVLRGIRFATEDRSSGGIGMFDVSPLPYQFILLTTQAAPFFSYTAINPMIPTLAVPMKFFTVPTADIKANTLRSTYVQHPKRNYVMQWNLNVQQQLTPSLAAMVAYVGSRGIHQPFRVDESLISLSPPRPLMGICAQVDFPFGKYLFTGM